MNLIPDLILSAAADTAPLAQPTSYQPAKVLICGASGAIGQAVALGFAAQGAQIYLHAHQKIGVVDELLAALKTQAVPDTGQDLLGYTAQADLRDAQAAADLVQKAYQAMNGLDILVTAMGGAKDTPFLFMEAKDMVSTMDSNLLPAVNVCEAYRRLIENSPATSTAKRIINISSITGLVGQPMRFAYGAAKGAIIGYSKSLARELASAGVTVNCVAPQVIEGGLADMMKGRIRQILQSNTPVGRSCTGADIAAAVLYLASPQAGFVTGTVVNITGGLVTW